MNKASKAALDFRLRSSGIGEAPGPEDGLGLKNSQKFDASLSATGSA
ncbi:MAG: hypothetical protein WC986_02765 [Elusimicrobiota bacterium]